MIELEILIKSLKISWIKCILETAETGMLSQIYLNKLKQFGGKLFFQCKFSNKDVDKNIQKNTFFKEIMTVWCKKNSTETIFRYGNELL